MHAFQANTRTITGEVSVNAGIEFTFPLFSPGGERLWVPDWDPEYLHPATDKWQAGQVFRTREGTGDAIWCTPILDRENHLVEYYRVEPGHFVAHIVVRCQQLAPKRTKVTVSHSYVGLSETGNREIAEMSQGAYEQKLARWSHWIQTYLSKLGRGPSA